MLRATLLCLLLAGCAGHELYPATRTCHLSLTLKLASPDVVNAWMRDKGGQPIQPVSGSDSLSGELYLSWPPSVELGMDLTRLTYAAGYELLNLCHIQMDPKGR